VREYHRASTPRLGKILAIREIKHRSGVVRLAMSTPAAPSPIRHAAVRLVIMFAAQLLGVDNLLLRDGLVCLDARAWRGRQRDVAVSNLPNFENRKERNEAKMLPSFATTSDKCDFARAPAHGEVYHKRGLAAEVQFA
jgi:hypothetical protein